MPRGLENGAAAKQALERTGARLWEGHLVSAGIDIAALDKMRGSDPGGQYITQALLVQQLEQRAFLETAGEQHERIKREQAGQPSLPSPSTIRVEAQAGEARAGEAQAGEAQAVGFLQSLRSGLRLRVHDGSRLHPPPGSSWDDLFSGWPGQGRV